MAEKPKNSRRSWLKYLPFAVLALLLLVSTQRQAIYDQVRLYSYEPPASVVELADNTAMTDSARRMYYVNHPKLVSRDSFADFCPNSTEHSVVLGCYLSGQRGIYLLQVTNEELEGIEEVTAAHEMLHAAYDRLSSGERNRIDQLLRDFYDSQENNEALQETVGEYKDSEPEDIVNEMHSIFATQVANLPFELEEYYGRYFTDRSQVTDLYARYEEAFTSRQKQIEQYDSQLNSLKSQIDTLQISVERQQTILQSQRASLESTRNSSDVAAYNASVDAYNRAANRYNADLNRLEEVVESHNSLVNARNEIAFEERELVEALSTQ